ncbi:E3 ubiquitin-protein ligase TRIM45-like [Oculina patagonica]
MKCIPQKRCAPNKMESLLQQATCPICRDTYNEPKTISCLHTFCCECLTKHARASHRQEKLCCPVCQAEIDLPEGNRGFDGLPTSVFHKNLLSLLAVHHLRSGNGECITCGNCKNKTSDVCYCFDCAEFICPVCLHAHEVWKVFRGHKVKSVLKEFQADDYEAVLKRQPFCTEQFHEQEVTRFFCLRCQSCICHICIATNHQKHEVILLDEAADNEKGNIMADVTRIRDNERALKDVIRQFEETISNLESNIATAKRGVSQTAEQMITTIRARERETISSLETTRVTRLERINSAIEKVMSLIKQMNQAVEFAENLTQRSSSSDIMLNKETLKQRFEELHKVEVPKHHVTSFIKFTAACAVEGLRLGDIATEGADANYSTLEGLDQTFKAGVEAELILCAKTPEGEETNCPDVKQQIKVLIKPSKYDTNVIVSEMENGRFKVKFTPRVPGAYSIEVRINGKNLPDCPVIVKVKERELVSVGELDLKLFPEDKLKGPYGISVNTKGEIAIADRDGHCVYIFDNEGNCLTKIGGPRRKKQVQLNNPCGVAYLNDKEILIADSRIQQVDVQAGTLLKSFKVAGPIDVCLDVEDHIVVTESGKKRIHVMSHEGETISIFGDSGTEKLTDPTSCISYKNIFLVSDGNSNSIKVFSNSGTFLYKFGEQGNQDGQFDLASDMHLDRSNNLLVCDYYNGRVQQFSLDGCFTGKSSAHMPGPDAIATTPDGRVLVISAAAKKVHILK